MGKLRTEPKVKPFLSEAEYHHFLSILKKAKDAAGEHNVFYDLEPSEKPNKVRKAFAYVAEKEDIQVDIRRQRGKQSLTLNFKDKNKNAATRMSAEECRRRIISVLGKSKRPMQKAEIIRDTGISPSTWNLRVKELITEGKVKRTGERRDTKYSLAS